MLLIFYNTNSVVLTAFYSKLVTCFSISVYATLSVRCSSAVLLSES